ncbi:MAG: PPOX class F420-dependent oxidoreductase [Anaerolineae bacterium]|nr:PPOX class F420-dependent oxidoreductase [Anaerolineae bacterium]
MAETSTLHRALDGQQYILLTTFRKTGVGVPTPVWFALDGERMYVLTGPKAGKVKRIRHNDKVQFAPCTFNGKVRGPALNGVARILPTEERQKAIDALNKKYGLIKRLLDLFERHLDKRIYLEIKPAPGE